MQILGQEEISMLRPGRFNLQTNPTPAPGVRSTNHLQSKSCVCETAFAPWDILTMAQGVKLNFMCMLWGFYTEFPFFFLCSVS